MQRTVDDEAREKEEEEVEEEGVEGEGQGRRGTPAVQITLIFHVRRFVSVPNGEENTPSAPRRERETHPAVLKCHGANCKGQFSLEPVAPYQSTVVFAVLVGQVGNGGCDAGAEKLLPLVQVALVDFVKELVVSVHINRGNSG